MSAHKFLKPDGTPKKRQGAKFHALLRTANINPKFCDQDEKSSEFYLAFDERPDDALDYAIEIRRLVSNVVITETRNAVFNWTFQNGEKVSAAAVRVRLVGEPVVKTLPKPASAATTHDDYLRLIVERHGRASKPVVVEPPTPPKIEVPAAQNGHKSFARFAKPKSKSIFEENQREFAAVNARYRNEMVQIKRIQRFVSRKVLAYVSLDFSDGPREIAVELWPEDIWALKRQGYDIMRAGQYGGPLPRVTLTKYTTRWKLVDVFNMQDQALTVKGREWQEVELALEAIA